MNTVINEFIILRNIVKIYKLEDTDVIALLGLDMRISRGEIVSIVGVSGSGKSTLLNILGGLDTPTGGFLSVGGVEINRLKSKELEAYKRNTVGFVWQDVTRNLLDYLTVIENIRLPMILNKKDDPYRAMELLEKIGLKNYANRLPCELSNGQQQRIAIAVSLANSPDLLLADEPTGALDQESTEIILRLLRDIRDFYGTTIIIVTHNMHLAEASERFLRIRDGRIISESAGKKLNDKNVSPNDKELIVVDSVGRMQIPVEYRRELNIKDRVKVNIRNGKIIITPGE